MLMRAPEEIGSWTWDLDDVAEPGLESMLEIAGRMSAVLEAHALWRLTHLSGLVHHRKGRPQCELPAENSRGRTDCFP
ncbi:hypothetical protein OHA91_30495 [Streptomyces erythrochromogenes]|uniref:Uncharacterized protein n=1 Tax=Streptomyces erythrochromogenes TaxID=285574 RepID=A0ABZ1QJ89_9ACTN|nr:hypothetical protein [Streptomyces erythrochromogenes]